MRHFVIVGILVIIMAVLTYLGLDAAGLMPEQASVQAIPVDWMWNLQVIAMSFLFALIIVPLFYSLVVFRRKKGDTGDGEYIEGNTPLEIVWTVIPLFAVLSLAYLGAYTLGETRVVDPQAMKVDVTARQFSFGYEYPEYEIASDVLYLPVGKQAHLNMTSIDVIHSFWVPEFRIKQDIVPGIVTEYRITPSEEGTYTVRCAELCGAQHAYMLGTIQVVSRSEFEQWVTQKQAEAAEAAKNPESRGEALITQNGCTACHSLDGSTLLGPTWLGLYNAEVELADGTTVIADDAFLTESIVDPQATIVAGFETVVMPSYQFTEDELADIIAYLATLK
ncbi:MAG: cytochrome c oxidase subunit II [Anaerolineales bacterium]